MASLGTMVTSSSSSSTQLFHHLFRHQIPPACVCPFLRPFCVSTITQKAYHHLQTRFRPFFAGSSLSTPPSSPFIVSHYLSALPGRRFPVKSHSSIQEPELEEQELEEEEEEEEEEEGGPLSLSEEEEDTAEASGEVLGYRLLSVRKNGDFASEVGEKEESDVAAGVPEMGREKTEKSGRLSLRLSVKEKKELASYAHSLGKELKCQLVGKSGVTDTVISSLVETLEKNELLKIKIHRTCPGELEDVVQHLEEATGSVVVGQIGRTVIVYRPSITKLRAEEKKKEAQRTRRPLKFNPASRKKGYSSRPAGRGRRGASRVSTA